MEGELQLDFFKVCCNQNHSMILCHGITVMICYALLHIFHGNYIVTMLYPVFSSHMLHEVFSSSCCSTHSKCSYQTISLSLDKFRLTLPFLPKKKEQFASGLLSQLQKHAFLLKVYNLKHNPGKESEIFTQLFYWKIKNNRNT